MATSFDETLADGDSMKNKPSNRTLSRDVSRRLNEMGYSKTSIWQRIRDMNIRSKLVDYSIKFSIETNNERIYIGSQREGLSLPGLSDIDVLQVDHDVICSKTKPDNYVQDNRAFFKVVNTYSPAGYCQLQIDQSNVNATTFEKYKYAMIERYGHTYLSSKLFVAKLDDDMLKASKFAKMNSTYLQQHGPSTPKVIRYPLMNSLVSMGGSPTGFTKDEECDFVRAFPYDGHDALNDWYCRQREYNWPKKKLIRYIMSLPIYVVPVGKEYSKDSDLEWRISFVLAEIQLILSFNNAQSKIFLLLKLIARHYFRLSVETISSYIMKNVMLWLVEKVPQKKFRQQHLIARLMDSLQILEESVMSNTLPCYMQPKRNLLTNKLDQAHQDIILSRIDFLKSNFRKILCEVVYNEQSCQFDEIRKIIGDYKFHYRCHNLKYLHLLILM